MRFAQEPFNRRKSDRLREMIWRGYRVTAAAAIIVLLIANFLVHK
jgi:hypothetical protein